VPLKFMKSGDAAAEIHEIRRHVADASLRACQSIITRFGHAPAGHLGALFGWLVPMLGASSVAVARLRLGRLVRERSRAVSPFTAHL